MSEQKISRDKGIITPTVIEALNKYMKKTDTKALIEAIKIEEPNLLPAIKSAVDETSTYFTSNGITGRTLSLIKDACFTAFLRGFLLYREGVKLFDASKLDEIYNQDFEAWEDHLIDEYMQAKAIKSSGNIK